MLSFSASTGRLCPGSTQPPNDMIPKLATVIDASDAEHLINLAHVCRVGVTGGTVDNLRCVEVELVSGTKIVVLASGKSDGEAIRNCWAGICSTAKI